MMPGRVHSLGLKAAGALAFLLLTGVTQPGKAAELDHVVIAQSNETLIWAPLYVARKLGYFKDEGIDVEVSIVKSGPAAVTAVTTGSAQIAVGFPATPIQAISKGFKVKIFAALSDQFIAELMLRTDVAARLKITADSTIEQRITALKGLTIATNGTGSANDYLLKRIIGDAGMQPDVDVTITPIGAGATILAALDQHRIDGFVASPPVNVIAVHDHGTMQLIDFARGQYRPLAGIIYIGLTAPEDWLRENPQLAARTVRALARALALMHDDPASAKAAVRSFFPGIEQELFDVSWDSQLGSFPRTPRLTAGGIATMMDFASMMNGHKLGVVAAQVFTNDYVDLAERLR